MGERDRNLTRARIPREREVFVWEGVTNLLINVVFCLVLTRLTSILLLYVVLSGVTVDFGPDTAGEAAKVFSRQHIGADRSRKTLTPRN